MLFIIIVFVSFDLTFLSATIKPITSYQNAQYDPIDTRFMFQRSSSIRSANSCICLCLSNPICSMATHLMTNRTCLLYTGQFKPEELRVAPSSWNATFYSFGNLNTTCKTQRYISRLFLSSRVFGRLREL